MNYPPPNKDHSEWKLLFDVTRDLTMEYSKFIDDLKDDDHKVDELTRFLRFIVRDHSKLKTIGVDINRMKVFFSILNLSDNDIKRIISFIESTGYGWQGNKYVLSNRCLSESATDHCKCISPTSDMETVQDRLDCLSRIFFNKEYGQLTLFLFCYCLAALFSKRLNGERFPVPFYLQISCDRSSVLFRLIEEIAEICDVNSGLADHCRTATRRRCEYKSQVYYPTQSVERDIDYLISENSDIPVIVDGFENSTYYNNLLRAVANIPNSRTVLAQRDKFNVLPVFVCPAIKSRFGNIFSMELADSDVSTNYLEFLKKNKQMLASYVLKFVEESDWYLFPNSREYLSSKYHPFKSRIEGMANGVRKKYRDLTLIDARNVGFFNFFFKGFINAVHSTLTIPLETEFGVDRNNAPITMGRYLDDFTMISETKLSLLHYRYHPAPRSEGIQNADAIRLAREIKKKYGELNVSIRVTPTEVKNDRYIFDVETLGKTKDSDVSSNCETVQHRLKEYECFRLDKTSGKGIKLIVAKSQLQDNNLLGFLEHESFSDSKKELPYAIGVDEAGNPYFEDIVDFPHLLIGGSTKSGKSTAIRSLLLSVAYKHRTGNAYVVIIDLLSKTSESEFSVFNDHPIMACPVIQDPLKAARVILTLRDVMNSRPMDRSAKEVPYIVCVIDEFPTLFCISNKEYVDHVKSAIAELLSKGRHANIHMVFAAQDPSKDNVGNISNVKSRMAFKCSHYKYSMNIIGKGDAAKLHGKGQMILKSDYADNKRLLGSFIDDKATMDLLDETKATFVQKNSNPFMLNDSDLVDVSSDKSSPDPPKAAYELRKESRFKSFDELLPEAIMWALPQSKVANSRLLKYLHVSDKMGNQILEWMAQRGLLSRLNGNLGWKVEPVCYEVLDEAVITVLVNAGYAEDEIKAKLNERT